MIKISYIYLILAAVPSCFTGFCFWLLEKKIAKKEQRQEEREKVREQNELLLVKSVGAAIALGEASAIALKNGHTNGETEAALEYARQIKHEQKDFLYAQGVKSII